MIRATVTTCKSNSCMYDTEFVNGLLQKKQQYRLYNKCGFLKNACICSLYLRLHLCTHCKPRSQFAVRLWHQHRVMLGLILHATDWCLKFLTLTHTHKRAPTSTQQIPRKTHMYTNSMSIYVYEIIFQSFRHLFFLIFSMFLFNSQAAGHPRDAARWKGVPVSSSKPRSCGTS